MNFILDWRYCTFDWFNCIKFVLTFQLLPKVAPHLQVFNNILSSGCDVSAHTQTYFSRNTFFIIFHNFFFLFSFIPLVPLSPSLCSAIFLSLFGIITNPLPPLSVLSCALEYFRLITLRGSYVYNDGTRALSLHVLSNYVAKSIFYICRSASETTPSVSTNIYQVPWPCKIDFSSSFYYRKYGTL